MMLLLWLCLLAGLETARGFVWPIKERLYYSEAIIVSEGHMFAKNRGPPLMESGNSFIDVDVELTT